MGVSIGDPTEETGKGMEGAEPGKTLRDRTMGEAQDKVAEEALTLVGDRMGRTAEAEVRNGGFGNNTNPPHQCGQRIRGGGQNCWDGGKSAYKEKLIGGMGEE